MNNLISEQMLNSSCKARLAVGFLESFFSSPQRKKKKVKNLSTSSDYAIYLITLSIIYSLPGGGSI